MWLHLLCRNDDGRQGVFQGLWGWNMAVSLGTQVFLYLTHKRIIKKNPYDTNNTAFHYLEINVAMIKVFIFVRT